MLPPSRYYNTTERMTGLFGKITDQMIVNCKDCITGKDSMDALWEKVWDTAVRGTSSY